MKKGLALGVAAQKGLPDLVGRQRGGQRQVAAGQALGQAQQVGRHSFLFAGEHRAGAAEADRHFVGNQQHVVPPGQLAHAAQIAARVHEHAGRRLHQRLDHDGRDPLVMLGQNPLHRRQIMAQRLLARHARRQPIHVGRGARSTSNNSGRNMA